MWSLSEPHVRSCYFYGVDSPTSPAFPRPILPHYPVPTGRYAVYFSAFTRPMNIWIDSFTRGQLSHYAVLIIFFTS